MFRRRGLVLHAFAIAVSWLATTGAGFAAPAEPTWSLVPQPADMRLAPSGVVKIANGALVAIRSSGGAVGANAPSGAAGSVGISGAGGTAGSGGAVAATSTGSATASEQLQRSVDQFIQLVANTRGLQLHATNQSDSNAAITFEVNPNANVTGDSGYRITVGADGIHVVARAPAGAFYGSVTLWQLLTPAGWTRGYPAEVANGTIEDHPRFAWRALMLDSGRHFQNVDDIKKLIDWMSLDKLNVLLWHVTEDQGWRLEIPKYPELTKVGACRKSVGLDIELTGGPDKPYCGFYTEKDVREIVRYAADRFVNVVPEIDIPGHSQAAVAVYPWLGVTGKRPEVWTNWGISPWLLKPDEKTLQFVYDVLDEVMRLFPSQNISIGGDEADKQQWNASPELRARVQKLGLQNMDQLQGWFTNRVADYLVKHGRRPVGWDDELIAGVKLPQSEVVMTWHGDEGQRIAREAAAQGHDVVLAPTDSLYFDYYQSDLPDESTGQPPMTTLRQAFETPVVPTGASAAEAARIIGVQGNLWTELTPTFAHDQHAIFPRLVALSEVGWSGTSRSDWNDFLRRLTAELGRERALGIVYSDTAFAPSFEVTAGREIKLSNQASFGEIRFTTDGSVPTATSTLYTRPLELQDKVTLRAATFSKTGFDLAAPRTHVLDRLTHNSTELESCSNQQGMRLDGSRPAKGPRPVYKADVGNMCWLWRRAPLEGVQHVTLTVERVAWRFGDEAKEAVVRPKTSAAGEFEIHTDSCTGPLLARLPLASAMSGNGQNDLNARVSTSKLNDARDLCIVATGDPREGQWVLARVAFGR